MRPTVWLTSAEPQAKRPVEPVLGGFYAVRVNFVVDTLIQRRRLYPFAIYCTTVGAICLLIAAVGGR